MRISYHFGTPKVIDCYFCGNVTLCDSLVADYPERETGYIDEVYYCTDCKDEAEKPLVRL